MPYNSRNHFVTLTRFHSIFVSKRLLHLFLVFFWGHHLTTAFQAIHFNWPVSFCHNGWHNFSEQFIKSHFSEISLSIAFLGGTRNVRMLSFSVIFKCYFANHENFGRHEMMIIAMVVYAWLQTTLYILLQPSSSSACDHHKLLAMNAFIFFPKPSPCKTYVKKKMGKERSLLFRRLHLDRKCDTESFWERGLTSRTLSVTCFLRVFNFAKYSKWHCIIKWCEWNELHSDAGEKMRRYWRRSGNLFRG